MTLVLGIDSGGTSTRAAIADGDGRVLGAASSGGGNIDDVGPDGAAAAIEAAVQGARASAHLEPAAFNAVCLGIAGVVSGADRNVVLAAVEPLRLARREDIRVDHDCRVALAGGLSGRAGIVLIAGTGSAAFGIDQTGKRWRAGGWGALMGDEGGSYSIALHALRGVARAVDGRGDATSLQRDLLAALGAADPDDLLHVLHLEGRGRAQIAALAPLVVRAAVDGDRLAQEVLEAAADELALMVDAVRRNLQFPGPAEVALVGGLFSEDSALVALVSKALEHRGSTARLVVPALPPVMGACLLALQSLGQVDDEVVERLRAFSAATWPLIGPAALEG